MDKQDSFWPRLLSRLVAVVVVAVVVAVVVVVADRLEAVSHSAISSGPSMQRPQGP